jgi:hypothetical protein
VCLAIGFPENQFAGKNNLPKRQGQFIIRKMDYPCNISNHNKGRI